MKIPHCPLNIHNGVLSITFSLHHPTVLFLELSIYIYNEFVPSSQVIDIYQSSTFNLKVKFGTSFTIRKSLVHQEAFHLVVPCQTQRYSTVTPYEAEHHPPSAVCTLCIETFCT